MAIPKIGLIQAFADKGRRHGIDIQLNTYGNETDSSVEFRVLSKAVPREQFRALMSEFSREAEVSLWVADAYDAQDMDADQPHRIKYRPLRRAS